MKANNYHSIFFTMWRNILNSTIFYYLIVPFYEGEFYGGGQFGKYSLTRHHFVWINCLMKHMYFGDSWYRPVFERWVVFLIYNLKITNEVIFYWLWSPNCIDQNNVHRSIIFALFFSWKYFYQKLCLEEGYNLEDISVWYCQMSLDADSGFFWQ